MKKLKLFASLATMCLCIAVLCMGIYAAQTVTYTIGGTISYTVEDVFAKINTKVYKVSGQQTTSTMKTNVDTLATTAFSNIDTNTYIEDTTNAIEEYDTTSSNTASQTVAITIDNTYMTYYIVINISNLADRAINAQLTDSTNYTNLKKASKLVQNGIAKGETKNLVVAFSLADKKVEIDSLSINYSIEVGYNEYSESTFLDTLKAETKTQGSEYWYVELGTLSDGTPIRWRVVSLDGTSKYTYTSEKPTVGTNTVFLQETCLGYTVAFDACDDTTRTDYDNYYKSDIRITINNLTTWDLPESDISSLITKRNITQIEGALTGTNVKYEGETSDYFWLLSDGELKYLYTYSSESSKKIWTPNNYTSFVAWWLRSPNYLTTSRVCVETGYGNENASSASSSGTYYVRAAFQLA